MNDAERAIARGIPASNKQIRREAEVASMFPAADTLSYRCRALVEMVDGHAATNLLLAQLQNVVNSAISAIRLEIVAEAATTAELIKEAQDATATTAVAKDGTGTSPVGTDATSPVARTEVGGRIEEGVSACRWYERNALDDLACSSPGRHPIGELSHCPWSCGAEDDDRPKAADCNHFTSRETGQPGKWNKTKDESRPSPLSGVREHVDSFLKKYGAASLDQLARAAGVDLVTIDHYVRAADNLKVGLSWAPVRFAEPTEEALTSPLSSLSAPEYGSMVGAVDAFFLRRPEGAILTLANVAHVTIDQMRAYVARADHLVLDHCDVVRRVSG